MATAIGRRPIFKLDPDDTFEEQWRKAQERYKGTIRTFARNCVHQLPGFGVEDVEQELLVVLWKVVMNYDASRGASFNTLFQGSARNRVISLVRTASTQSRTANVESLDIEAVAAEADAWMSDADTAERAFSRMELREVVLEHGIEILTSNRPGPKPKRKVEAVA